MIKLNLRRTWTEISEYLSSTPYPLRLVELINRVPPCSWTFKFTFDGSGQITVKINCDRNVSDDNVLALLDGTLEEILFADVIYLYQTGKYITADTARILENPSPSNIINFQIANLDSDFLLTLKGFWRSNFIPSEIQKESIVRSYFLENTWLGSHDFAESDHYIRWIVFASEYLICPGDRYENKLNTTDIFTTKTNLYNQSGEPIGYASFHISPLLKNDEVYTTFGPLIPKPENWQTRKRQEPKWIIEIGSEKLKQTGIQGESTTKIFNELVDSVRKARISVVESADFQDYVQRIQWKRQTESAESLNERQEKTRTRKRVIFNDKPLMLVPSNENEVLILLSKLEAIDALPFYKFILWEHTSKEGIDAIVSYQLNETDVQSVFVAAEIEHHFENFFTHGHPPNQVDLVICWDLLENKNLPGKLEPQSKWLFQFRHQNDESFYVVVLSDIPNLQFK